MFPLPPPIPYLRTPIERSKELASRNLGPRLAWIFRMWDLPCPHGMVPNEGCRSMPRSPERLGKHEFQGVGIPPVILPSKDGPRGPRGPRWLLALVFGVIAGGIALAVDSARSPDATAEPPVAGGPSAPVRVAAPGLGPAIDSLRAALDRYRQRQSDFERGRIDCAALAEGYDRVNREVMDLALRRRSARDPDAATISSFESVLEEAAAIDRRFDDSGCPRP